MKRCAASLLELLIVIAILGVLGGLTLSAIQLSRSRMSQIACASQLRQIGLAAQNHHAIHGQFPIGLTDDAASHPRMTWLAQLLPEMGQSAAWEQALAAHRINSEAIFDPPHRLNQTPMTPYVCPSDRRGLTRQPSHGRWVALTSYVGVYGINVDQPTGMLVFSEAIQVADVRDGLSNTLFVGERPASADCWYGWWYTGYGQKGRGNADMMLGVQEINTGTRFARHCPRGPYGFGPGRFEQQCDLFHFWSPHTGGANFAIADGSVRFLRYSADAIMPALATRAGDETAEIP